MSCTIVIRNVNPDDKIWIMREAKRRGLSMEEFVRRILHQARKNSDECLKPSTAFQRHFGGENGIDLPLSKRYGYKPISLTNEDAT